MGDSQKRNTRHSHRDYLVFIRTFRVNILDEISSLKFHLMIIYEMDLSFEVLISKFIFIDIFCFSVDWLVKNMMSSL